VWGFRERTRAVLVMSDRDARRKLAELLLAGGVIDVVSDVADARQAVGEARRLGKGAVIIDAGLLERFGDELIQEIKAVDPTGRVLVLAGSEGARAKALREGADQAIIKPRGLKKLAFGIGVALGRRPASQGPSPAQFIERAPVAQGLAVVGMGALLLLLTPYSGVQALGDRLAVLSLATGGVFFLYALKYYASVALILLTNPANGNGNGNGHSNGHGNGNGNGNGKTNGINGLSNPNGQKHQSAYQPFISIHLPVYNEPEVIDRLLSACTSFDYDRYEVIVADDSQDETSRILDNRWAAHPRVKISRRKARVGFKGAALQLALQRTDSRAEFVVVFDADFIPPPDILQQFLTYFYGTNGSETHSDKEPPRLVDDRLAAVQGYQWHVLNASENWITRGVRTEYSGSYVIERSSQQITGAMRMIAGSVFMIRADVMRQLGWGTSITEDWDLTLRLYETGYKVVYTPFVQAPAECVASVRQLARQRMRWAEGHTYNIKKHLMSVLLSPHITWPEKLEFLYYAPYYLQSALFIVGTISWLVVDLFLRKRFPFWPTALGWSLVFTNALSLIVMNLVGLFMERGVRRNWGGLMSFILLTYLLVPFQAYAAIKGLFETHEGGWHRTQKTGVITDVIEKLGLRRKMRGLLPEKKKKKDSIDIGRRLGYPLARLVGHLPGPVQKVASSSLGLRLASGMALAIILISVLSRGVPFASAAPDAFYLHDGSLNDGKMMDTNTGAGGSTMTFDTPAQSALWYTDLTYPTGAEDAGLAAGDYTLNLYFDQLPTLSSDWYDPDWLYRKKITIDHTKVAANQTDFPVLIDLGSDSDLAAKAQNAPTAGYDILFTESDGTTKISHEIEKFDDSTGELVAWVEVPTLSSTVDTELYMYYGNASAGNQQDPAGTWSNGYLEVWHLEETSGNHTDSTSNGYTGTATGSVDQNATGQIDGADEFLGPSTSTYLTLSDGDLANNASFTLSAWFRFDTATAWAGIATKGRETGHDWIGLWANGTQYIFGWDWQGGKGGNVNGATTLSTDTWYYGTATFDGTNRRLYLNDALDGGPSAGNYAGITASDMSIANDLTDGVANTFDGIIDEVRLSSTVRSLSWIQTEYNNQSSPSTFLKSVDAEQGQSSVDITVTVSHTEPDGSAPTTIVTTSTTINSTTANPLAIDLGSASAQTFTASDPQRLQVRIDVDSVTASGSFDLSYDSSSEPSSLETPAVVAPENSLFLLLIAVLIPLLTAGLTTGRRTGLRVVSIVGALVVALGLLARQVGVVNAAPDAFFLHTDSLNDGEMMNISQGSGSGSKTFDTVSQVEYWYTDVSYPTGQDDATLDAGDYTMHMYFDQLPDPWWDTAYAYREQITVSATDAVEAGYSVSLTFDHASLVSASKALASGQDVRVVHYDGSTYTELDRALDPLSSWNDANTQIWFALVDPITASGSDGNYYLYYGNSAAGSAPADWANVFMLGDDFNDGTLTSAVDTSTSGTASITEAGGEASIDLGTNELTDAGIIVDASPMPSDNQFFIRHKTKLLSGGGVSDPEVKNIGLQESAGEASVDTSANENPRRRIIDFTRVDTDAEIYYFDAPGSANYWDGSAWQTGNGFWGTLSLDTYYIHELISDGTYWHVRVSDASGTVLTTTTPIAWANTYDTGGPLWFYWGEIYTDYYYADQTSDWVYVRDYVPTEPDASLGTEEDAPFVDLTVSVQNTSTDGSDPQPITSASIRIDANTSNPLDLDLGSGAQQTFTQSDPRLIRVALSVDQVGSSASFDLAYDSSGAPTNLETPNLTVPEISLIFVLLALFIPILTFVLTEKRRRRMAARLVSVVVAVILALGLMPKSVVPAFASPDAFYLHDTATSGINPAGKYANSNIGTGGSWLTFDTPSQDAYWYSDISYPTGADDASIAAGNYTLNMYFDSLPSGAGNWYDPAWGYRKMLTIDHSQVADDLNDFAVLVSLPSDTDLSNFAQADGGDILFTSSDGTTKLDHEIENYVTGTGELQAWVRFPTISSSSDTDFYMYYANPSAADQSDSAATWDSNYVGVWHLDQSGDGTLDEFKDSTGNANDGTGGKGYSGYTPTRSTAQIGYGQTFDGTNDFIDMASSGWADDNWPYRKRIVIQGGQVSGSTTLNDFPVLINIPANSDSDLKYTGDGGHVGKIDGTDIFFTNDEGVKIDHQLEKYDPATGELLAWVAEPELYAYANTTIYMYYGYASAADQQNASGVWDTGYEAVWHLKEDPTASAPQFADSTSNANDGTAQPLGLEPAQAAGQIDGSLQFDGTNDRLVQVADNSSLQLGSDITVSGWVTTSSTDGQARLILAKWKSGQTPAAQNYWFGKLNDTSIAFYVDGSQNVTADLGLINDGSWHYVVGVADVTSGLLRLYVDGSQQNAAAYSGSSQTGGSVLDIGMSPDATLQDWDGQIDEVRVSGSARSADWIATEYANIHNPSSFYQILSEEVPSDITLDLTGSALTLEAWVRYDGSDAGPNGVMMKNGWADGYRLELLSNRRLDFELSGDTSAVWTDGTLTASPAWHHVVATYDGSTMREYVDGQPDTATTSRTGPIERAGKEFWIGHGDHAIEQAWSDPWAGDLDEVRVSSIARSPQWIETEYNNQVNQGTGTGAFIKTLTSPESAGSVGITVTVSSTAVDGSDATTIVSSSTTIDGSTSNPLALDLGSGALQTFTQSDPRLLRVSIHVDSVSGGASFDLGYDSSSDATSLETPNLTVPDFSLAFLALAILIPLLTATLTMRRKLAVRLVSTMGAVMVAIGLLSSQVSTVTAAPDLYYLHDAATGGSGNWYDASWPYRMQLTIDNSKVSGSSNLSYFPVLVNLTDSTWADTTHGGHVAQADGGDILFTASDGTTKLDHEIERYDNTSGELISWVEVPTVSYSSDTVIYMYYGNSGASDQWNISGTWDGGGSQNYRGVWHLNEASGSAADSTSYGTSGTVTGTVTRQSAGQVGYAYDYGTNGQVNPGSPGDGHLDFGTSSFTVSMWLNVDQSTGTWQLPLSKGGYMASNPGYAFETNQSGDGFQFEISDGSTYEISPVASIGFDTWYYVTGVVDRANDRLRLYIDGSEIGSGTDISSVTGLDSNTDLTFAYDAFDLDGLLDEVRIASSARTPGWIATEYNNQSSPSTFFKPLGAEETPGVSPSGKTMNTTLGAGAATLTFDTPGQNAYWYTDISYPTGQGDASVASGSYTLNMYFDQLPGSGTVSVDAVSTGTTTGGSSITISHTVSSGSSRLMLVGVSINNDSYETVSSVTWKGTESLSLVGAIANDDDARVEIWSRVAPSAGTGNVVISFSGALQQGAVAGVTTFTGVNQSTPLGTFTPATGNNSSPATVDVPSAAGELVFGVVCTEYEPVTTDPSQTERWNLRLTGTVGETNGAASTEAGAAPSVTTSWTLDPSYNHWAVGGVSIKPAAGSVNITASVYHTKPDGSDPQLIVSSSSTTIDSSTANPLALTIGSGAQQTFTAADPRLLRASITVDSVSGAGSFVLDYDSATDHSSLDTPVVTVPEWSLAFLILVPLIPYLFAAIWRRRRVAVLLGIFMGLIVVQLGIRASGVEAFVDDPYVNRMTRYTTPITDLAAARYGPEQAGGMRERLDLRDRYSRTLQVFEDGRPTDKFIWQGSLAPMYFQDAQGEWQDVQPTFTPSVRRISSFGDAAWEMAQNDYKLFIRGDLNADEPLVRYEAGNSEDWLEFSPQQLQWVDASGRVEPIATPNMSSTATAGNEAKWSAAYGPGIDLRLISHADRVHEWLDIAAPLPVPRTLDQESGDPVFEYTETLSYSRDLSIWIDGAEWDGSSEIETSNAVVFRDGDGQVVFAFPAPSISDAAGKGSTGQYRLVGDDGSLAIAVRVPLSWLQDATYPLRIDPTIDRQVSASGDDADRWGATSFSLTNELYLDYNDINQSDGMRWTNVAVPAGARIDSAYITVRAMNDPGAITGGTTIYGQAHDDPSAFTDYTDYDARARTTANVHWQPSAWVSGTDYDSPDIKAVIQEIVDRSGWASGQSMVLFLDADQVQDIHAESWDTNAAYAPKLHVEYSYGASVDAQVGASTDDVDRYDATGFDLAELHVWLDYPPPTTNQSDAVRFTNVAVPAGATIGAAHITFRAENSPSPLTAGTTIYGQADDDPLTFSTYSDYDARAHTSAYVHWQPSTWVADTDIESPDISAIIQEIVDRPGWSSGQAMAFFFVADAVQNIYAYSYDGSPTYAPTLHIEYMTPPDPPTNCQATFVSDTEIDVTWTDNSFNETGFKIESSVDGGGFSQIDTVGADQSSYPDTSTSADHSYQYRVRATNSAGDSSYCSATTTIYTSPDPPANVSASHTANLEITLSWTDQSQYEDQFRIERDKNGQGYVFLANDTDGSPFVDNTITQAEYDNHDTFTYRIRSEISSQSRLSTWIYSNPLAVPEWVFAFLLLVPAFPLFWSVIWRRRRLAGAIASTCLGVIFAVTLLASQIIPTTAAPDTFYLHDIFEEVQTGGSSSSNTVATSSSLTGATGQLYLAAVSTRAGSVTVSSVSGLGLTWTRVLQQCSGGTSQTRMEVWSAIGTPTGNGVVTATLSGAATNAVIAVSRYAGVNTSNPIGATTSANVNGVSGSCSGGTATNSPTVNLTTQYADSYVYGAFAIQNRSFTAGTGYTERAEIHQGSSTIAGAAVEDRLVASPSTLAVNGTLSGTTQWAVAAIEIRRDGFSPTGRTMNIISGTGGSTMAFDTAGQNAYWYVDQTWPTGSGNGGIAAGPYNLNMYFNERPHPWWNANYTYRQKITVTAGGTNVPTGYSIRVQFNHQSLVSGGKSLSSGNDVRIVYWNGSSWTELDRRLDDQSSWNSTTTQVWFETQAAINAGQSDGNYYMYYGYSGAGTPPTTWSNVFLFYDDFSAGTLDSARWACAHGTCTQSGGTLTLGANSGVFATATYALGTDTRWEGYLRLGGDGSVNSFNYLVADQTGDFSTDVAGFWTDDSTHYVENENDGSSGNQTSYVPSTPTSYHFYAFNREGTSGVRYYQDSTQIAYKTTYVPDASLRMLLWNDSATANGQVYDWVRVRKYVNPEPTAAFGAEATSGNVQIVVTVSHTAPDGSGATTILSSSTTSINSSTANPYTLSIGSGAQQTFTSGNPRRLRVQINVSAINGEERFVLAYDGACASSQCSNLDTPVVTVPEPGLGLIGLAITLPALAAELGRRRKSRKDRMKGLTGGLM
jgi:cellulose synthase/poly-beta-1,6-N-acetylglucosamine synthase-like glycosyltransferase